jgi:hypothetical protein
MENWVIIVLISLALLLVIISIIGVSRYLENVKLKKAKKIIIQKEEDNRLRRQKILAEIDAKAKVISDRRHQIKKQFEWLEGMNKKIKDI